MGLEESAAFRTNLGLVNTSTEVCTVTVELYSAAGVRQGTVVRTLLPRSMEQVQAPFAGLGGVVDGRVTVTSDRGPQRAGSLSSRSPFEGVGPLYGCERWRNAPVSRAPPRPLARQPGRE